MTKKEIVKSVFLQKLSDIRYSGKLKKFFVKLPEGRAVGCPGEVNLETTTDNIRYPFKGIKRGYRKWSLPKKVIVNDGVIFSNK